MRFVFLIFILLTITVSNSFAQYTNTCELVVVPGLEEPVSLQEYALLQKSEPKESVNYLATFMIPGNGGNILSTFGPRSGRMHYGIDLKMEKGDTVYAVNSGTLTSASWGTGFGNIIVIQHDNDIETYYAHLSKFLKTAGDWVQKGEAIGLAGSTGRARGVHLHFELHQNGTAFDPELVFDFGNNEIREEAKRYNTLLALHQSLKPSGYANNLAVPEFYKVRSGDNLWAISRRYKTSIQDLCRLNNISEQTVLRVGQPLRMY